MTIFLLGPLRGLNYLRCGLESSAVRRGFQVVTDPAAVDIAEQDIVVAISDQEPQLVLLESRMNRQLRAIGFIGSMSICHLHHGWQWINPNGFGVPAQKLQFLLQEAGLGHLPADGY